ncbi:MULTISPECIES: PilW family protein [Vibrio]|uniref:MSHA biogenesis protein MshO n=1 Tax=Vibrio tasmaniensis 1F-267 TaxID=1191324 RepID=A0ABX3B6P4_9VIBR|nr:prepilin-type N-terminal cleavage/methylation domain-containing protein [Vibrio tasmaniensis]OEF49433.1 MSHA biogenesis protein MshO [Vibrio tasmaniensis 1F-267]
MRRQGFTLIEMIITMIVGSILVVGIAGFVELGARGYADTVDRQRLQTQAKFVLEKITREVRHAVPNMFNQNAVVPGSRCVSFFPIVTSGIYAMSGDDIQFVTADNALTAAVLVPLSLVINPTEAAPTNNIFPLATVTATNNTFLLANESVNLVGNSVSNRHYIYNPNGRVTYCIVNGRVWRSEGNGALIPISDTGVTGDLDYQPANVQRNGIVHLEFEFRNQVGDELTNFQQDIQVINVP